MKFSIFTAVTLLAVATSAASTTKKTSTTAAPAPTAAPVFGQCGGVGWTGPTSCVSGHVCSTYNPYYAQCLY
ncbi:hypothetical protein TWF696_003925 [Orbilia brochopaga]|uniref:CBM1 domain-containing protein n=1 Tax=Orbilia brochopaga TaxID=3140254 RepID=A0AAV9V4J4_9PEZI